MQTFLKWGTTAFFCFLSFTFLVAAAGFLKTSPRPSQDFLIRALLPGTGLPEASLHKSVLRLLGVSGSSRSLVRIFFNGLLAGPSITGGAGRLVLLLVAAGVFKTPGPGGC